ncbi:MAG: hypothetical protein WKF89_16660, partial [Chitinophagaceae bacterium]
SVLMLHPENTMPFCARNYTITDKEGNRLFEKIGNYQTRNKVRLPMPVITTELKFQFEQSSPNVPVSLFEIRCYADGGEQSV